jgi:hypothetical protein
LCGRRIDCVKWQELALKSLNCVLLLKCWWINRKQKHSQQKELIINVSELSYQQALPWYEFSNMKWAALLRCIFHPWACAMYHTLWMICCGRNLMASATAKMRWLHGGWGGRVQFLRLLIEWLTC